MYNISKVSFRSGGWLSLSVIILLFRNYVPDTISSYTNDRVN